MFCKDCKEDAAASLLEQKLSLCLPCIEIRAVKYEELKEENATTCESNENLKQALNDSEAKVDKIGHMMHAELAGQSSAQSGLGEDQNPFLAEDQRHIMWLSGWTAVDTRRKALQAHAVMTWAGGVLTAVNELAKGYGQEEIASKLDVVISKFGQFVQTE